MRLNLRIHTLLVALSLGLMATAVPASKIIVNELFYNSSGTLETGSEYLELLVVENLTAAELEGFYYGDSQSAQNSKVGAYKFTAMSGIASTFPKGTIIVVAGSGSALTEDTTLNTAGGDWTIIIKENNATYITKSGSTGDLAGNDVAWVDTAASGSSIATDGFGVSWGTNTGTLALAANVRIATGVSGTNPYLYLTSDLTGAATDTNWSLGASGSPGDANGGANTTYVNSLRGVAADNPDASVAPSPLDFGKIPSTTTRDRVVAITNSAASSVALSITSPGFNFGGTDSAKFSVVGSPTFPISVSPGTSTTLTIRFTPGADGVYSANMTLSSNDAHNPVVSLAGEGATPTDAATIAAARALASGTYLRITGNVTVISKTNGLNTGGNEFFIQDTSGSVSSSQGLLIYDPSNAAGQVYNIGDQLNTIVGTKGVNGTMVQLTLGSVPTKVGTVAPPSPRVITSADSDISLFQGELIKIQGITVNAGLPADTVWGGTAVGTGKNYALTAAVGTISYVRIEEGSGIVGVGIPSTAFDMTGIAYAYSTGNEIEPRLASDQGLTAVEYWNLY